MQEWLDVYVTYTVMCSVFYTRHSGDVGSIGSTSESGLEECFILLRLRVVRREGQLGFSCGYPSCGLCVATVYCTRDSGLGFVL